MPTQTAEDVDLAMAGISTDRVEVPAVVMGDPSIPHRRRADMLQEHLAELAPLLEEAIAEIAEGSMLRAELQCALPIVKAILAHVEPVEPVTEAGQAGRNPWGGERRTRSDDSRDGMAERPSFDAEDARVLTENLRRHTPPNFIGFDSEVSTISERAALVSAAQEGNGIVVTNDDESGVRITFDDPHNSLPINFVDESHMIRDPRYLETGTTESARIDNFRFDNNVTGVDLYALGNPPHGPEITNDYVRDYWQTFARGNTNRWGY